MKHKHTLTIAGAALVIFGAWTASRAAEIPVTSTNQWQSTIAAGATLTRGNSDTFLGTITAATGKKWDQNELAFGADVAYGTTEGTKTIVNTNTAPPTTTKHTVTTTTAETVHGFGQYNRLFTEKWYGYGRLEGLHDGVAGIEYRFTLGVGAGYYFFKTKATQLSAEVGPGYIVQKLDNQSQQNYATLRLGDKFTQELSDRSRLWQTAEILPQVDDFNNFIVNFEIGIEADLSSSKKLSLRTYLDDTYNNVPAPDRKKNDLKLVAAIAYKF